MMTQLRACKSTDNPPLYPIIADAHWSYMNCYLTQGFSITPIESLAWLTKNAHRVINLRVLKYLGSDAGKLMAIMKDGSMFHAPFHSHRSMIAWVFHPQFEGKPFGVFGYEDPEPFRDWNEMQLDHKYWLSAGSHEHWKLLSEVMGK